MPDIDVGGNRLLAPAPGTTYERPTTSKGWELPWLVEGASRLLSGGANYVLPPVSAVGGDVREVAGRYAA